MTAVVQQHHYSSGRAFYLVVCEECHVVLNSGHHYLEPAKHHADDLAEKHNAEAHLETFTCTWLYEDGYDEDGEQVIRECGGVATVRPDQSGWDCTNDHEYTTMQARADQGWDYYDDDDVDAAREHGIYLNRGPR